MVLQKKMLTPLSIRRTRLCLVEAALGGVNHRAGGLETLDECREIRRHRFPEGLPTGETAITGDGNLKAKFVIHTVVPFTD